MEPTSSLKFQFLFFVFFSVWALKGKRGGIKPEKDEWDHCHAAESLLWRGTEGGVEGQTDGEAAEKSEADGRKRRAFPSPDEKQRGLWGVGDNAENRKEE